jgi:hypothetical protein
MRYFLSAIALMSLILVSCESSPVPPSRSESDSLVIGSLVLDFPDGYFSAPPRNINSGIWIDILNKTQESRFKVLTNKEGYFWFLSNGTDEYSIETFVFGEKNETGGKIHTCTVEGKISYDFATTTRCVQYIGDITILYEKPLLVKSENIGASPNTYWKFNISSSLRKHPLLVQAYLKNSAWAEYEIH